MPRTILISAGDLQVEGELNDSPTAEAIWISLPLHGRARRWGDEIYFTVPLELPLDDPHELVENGDLGYWPQGPAFCIFFGPTPMSRGAEIRPASAVNVFGRVVGDIGRLAEVTDDSPISVVSAVRD